MLNSKQVSGTTAEIKTARGGEQAGILSASLQFVALSLNSVRISVQGVLEVWSQHSALPRSVWMSSD